MDLRVLAVSRLMLDNIATRQSVLDHAGHRDSPDRPELRSDDIDGTVRHELIYHDAGATTPEMLSVERLRQTDRGSGNASPVERDKRDTLYNRIERDPNDPVKWKIAS